MCRPVTVKQPCWLIRSLKLGGPWDWNSQAVAARTGPRRKQRCRSVTEAAICMCWKRGPQGALTVSEDGPGEGDQPGTMRDVGRRPGISSLLAFGHAIALQIIGRGMIGGLTACSGHRSNSQGGARVSSRIRVLRHHPSAFKDKPDDLIGPGT